VHFRFVLRKGHRHLRLRRKVCNQRSWRRQVLSNSCRWLAVVCLRAIEDFALEEDDKLTVPSDGPFGGRLARAGSSVIGDVAQAHHTRQRPSTAEGTSFRRRTKSWTKPLSSPLWGPSRRRIPRALQGADSRPKERKACAADHSLLLRSLQVSMGHHREECKT
jgi:hypothetical protein